MSLFAVAIYIQEEWEQDESDEFFALIRSAGYEIHPKIFKQRAYFSSRMLLSPGRIQELSMFLEDENDRKIAVIVVSQELSPRQALNLEEELNLDAGMVIDKFELILKVFEAHSTTEESKLRCQLARMRRELPLQKLRLLHKMGAEKKAAGGIGSRGPGVSKIEDFETITQKQVATVEKKLDRIRSRRELQRKLRKEDKNALSISVLGYTCAGKSTLVNALTQSSKLIPADSSMFTTLAPQTRRTSLSGLRCLITDTVGFIENLPEILRESFLSTLEEGLASDVLLLCVDASESPQEVSRKLRAVLSAIDSLGDMSLQKIIVLTKKDLGLKMSPNEVYQSFHLPVATVSGATNDTEEIKQSIKKLHKPTRWKIEVEERSETFSLRSFLYDQYSVESETFEDLVYRATFLGFNILSLKKRARKLGLSPKIKLLGS